MKHIKLFKTKTEFDSEKKDIQKPWVSFTQDDNTVHYSNEKPAINNNGFEYVDLGLPSGLKWATCNIGATSPDEYGDYFMWGSTTPDTDNTCDWTHAPFNNGSSSFDSTYFNEHKSEWLDGDVLKPEYDAAHVIMGGDWRIPTHEDFVELDNNTTSEWTQLNGVNGCLLTSNANGNTLFIPATGGRLRTAMKYQGECVNLVSSSLGSSNREWIYYLDMDYDNRITPSDRCNGFSVRGVIN